MCKVKASTKPTLKSKRKLKRRAKEKGKVKKMAVVAEEEEAAAEAENRGLLEDLVARMPKRRPGATGGLLQE